MNDDGQDAVEESKVSRYQFIKIIGATGILVTLASFAGIRITE